MGGFALPLLPYWHWILGFFFGFVLVYWIGERLGMQRYGRFFAPAVAIAGLIIITFGARWGWVPLILGASVTAGNFFTRDYNPKRKNDSHG